MQLPQTHPPPTTTKTTKKPCPYAYITLFIALIFFIYSISLTDRTPADTFLRLKSAIANFRGETNVTSSGGSTTELLDFARPSSTIYLGATPVPIALGEVGVGGCKELSAGRKEDMGDVFEGYRNQDLCQLSSLALHTPFEPLCNTRQAVLDAMSYGGRPGFDAPYMPRACDMRFYSPSELCGILSRFAGVVLVGDSIVRHVTNALWIMMRGDMGYGAIRRWDVVHLTNETEDCACQAQFSDAGCNSKGFHQRDWRLMKTGFAGDVELDATHACGSGEFPTRLTYQPMLDWPLDPVNMRKMLALLPEERPGKPVAMVFGHALWNNVDLNVTELWMDDVLDEVRKRPYAVELPKLFLSTSAGGVGKPNRWLQTQSVQKMAEFEVGVRPLAESRGMEFLGTWNMSVQATSVDGTHSSLEVNLLKAMMVFNWLDKLDVSTWKSRNDTLDPELSP